MRNFFSAIIAVIVLISAGCKEKPKTQQPDYDTEPQFSHPRKQISYDATDIEDVMIKHGDSSLFVLKYMDPNTLFQIQNVYQGKTGFKLTVGGYNQSYPSALFILPTQSNKLSRSYHFFNRTGVITRIATQNDHQYEGPYYEFDSDGVLIVSGFYNKDGYAVKIWRLYNNNGEIVETINADTTKMNILKKFGRE